MDCSALQSWRWISCVRGSSFPAAVSSAFRSSCADAGGSSWDAASPPAGGLRIEAFGQAGLIAPLIRIGSDVRVNDYVHIGAVKSVSIGDRVLIASKVFISDHNHGAYGGDRPHSDPRVPPNDRPLVSSAVVIEDDVWIGGVRRHPARRDDRQRVRHRRAYDRDRGHPALLHRRRQSGPGDQAIQPRDAALGERLNPRIVISGVNLVDLGPLSVFRDALRSLVQASADRYEIVALVQREELLAVPGVTYLEFPEIKGSWLRRLRFEYLDSYKLSLRLAPALWIAMHDITPRLRCARQVVYCHNPSPFYRFRLREAVLDPKFGLFTLLYRFLYGIFLQRNWAVVVQQAWIREEFERRYDANHVIVARPAVHLETLASSRKPHLPGASYRFFYPAFARTFKNHEVLLAAARLLEERGVRDFELLLTVAAESNRCAADLARRFADLRSVRWLGTLSREQVFETYTTTDCLVFPSKLETWGLPLTEFKATGGPILAADLAYAHETMGDYREATFFDPENASALADLMECAMAGTLAWSGATAAPIRSPFAEDWPALWAMLLPEPSAPSGVRSAR